MMDRKQRGRSGRARRRSAVEQQRHGGYRRRAQRLEAGGYQREPGRLPDFERTLVRVKATR